MNVVLNVAELTVFIGWDPREQDAYNVAERSLRKHASIKVDVRPLVLNQLRAKGLYSRPTSVRPGHNESLMLWDDISDAPMATEFSLSRFVVPELTKGWVLYCDCDFLFRSDVAELLDYADKTFALLCVPHFHAPIERTKMDGQRQTNYTRKNWSSFMLWNSDHLMHAGQKDRLNRWPGLWLHQLKWLHQEEIGSLPADWNWLTGSELDCDPKAVHFTRGIPSMAGFEREPFADEWRSYL